LKINHAEDYRAMRQKAYPPIGDQLDAVMKLANVLGAYGIALPLETREWIEACQKVKDQYPKY